MVESMPTKMEEAGLSALLPPSLDSTPIGEPNDVAYLMLYLASDESKFVSGATMCVDNTMSVTTGTVTN